MNTRDQLFKVHPNMSQFLEENSFGMSKIEELANRTITLYKALADAVRSSKLDGSPVDRIPNDIKEYLTPDIITLMTSDRWDGLSYINQDSRGKVVSINLFGNLKLGERAKQELPDDITFHYSYSEKMGKSFFDLEKCICAGFKIRPLMDGIDGVIYDDATHYPIFDVSTILVRCLNTGNVLGNLEEVEKAIITVMLSRLVKAVVSMRDLAFLLDDLLKFKEGEINYKDRTKSYDMKYVVQTLFGYKVWYNAINDIDNSDVEKTVTDIVDLVNLASHSFNATQAIPDVYNTIHSRIMSGVMDCPRYPDKVIEETMDFYRKASNYYRYRGTNGRRSHGLLVSRKAVIGVESVAFESFLASVGVTKIGMRDNKRASLAMFGYESLDTSSKEFEDFKKNSRAKILAGLTPEERSTYIKYEADVIRFRAEVIGCRTPFSQSIILKRGDTIAKLINLEVSKSHSEAFITLMMMLDSERINNQSILANRDFFREKNTMLNGQLGSMKDEWSY